MTLKTKPDLDNLFSSYFQIQEAIYDYFGVGSFATYDYELRQNASNWHIDRNNRLHWEIPLDVKDAEGTYQGRIIAIHRKEFHTLIFTPSDTGEAGFAYIFDNEQELKELPNGQTIPTS